MGRVGRTHTPRVPVQDGEEHGGTEDVGGGRESRCFVHQLLISTPSCALATRLKAESTPRSIRRRGQIYPKNGALVTHRAGLPKLAKGAASTLTIQRRRVGASTFPLVCIYAWASSPTGGSRELEGRVQSALAAKAHKGVEENTKSGLRREADSRLTMKL